MLPKLVLLPQLAPDIAETVLLGGQVEIFFLVEVTLADILAFFKQVPLQSYVIDRFQLHSLAWLT